MDYRSTLIYTASVRPARLLVCLPLQNKLATRGRKMVTIIDPHIKRTAGYHIHTEATEKGLYIKNKDGGDFNGWCWPGDSSYLDFTNPDVRSWWADQFALDKYSGSTHNLYTWNDMNEPSVFNGPEVSMTKVCTALPSRRGGTALEAAGLW